MFAYKKLIVDITPQVKALNVDLKVYYPIAVESLSAEGQLFGIPWISHPGRAGVFFNKDLFDAAKVKQPTEAWTWADLTAAAIALTKRTGNRVEQFGYSPDTTLGGYHMTCRTFGGEYVSPDGKKAVFDSPEAIKAIQTGVADMFSKHKVAPTPDSIEGGTPQMFGSKRVAMFQSGYWGIADIKQYAKDIQWGVVPQPVEANGKRGTLGVDTTAVSKTAKDRDTGALFCAFMGSKEAGIDIAKRGSVPGGRPDVWESPELASAPGHLVFAKIQSSAPRHNVLANFRDSEFDATFTKAMDPLRFGQEADAAKLIKQVIPSLQAVVDKPAD
jgi:multiple sugar transport system substrate-binding protein